MPVIIRDTESDSALLFTASQPDSHWINDFFGFRYNRLLPGFPIRHAVKSTNASVAVLPPTDDTLHLIYSTNMGVVEVHDMVLDDKNLQFDWPMPGLNPGGNRLYRSESFYRAHGLDENNVLLRKEISPVYVDHNPGTISFTIYPETTGNIEINLFNLSGTILYTGNYRVWGGFRRKIDFEIGQTHQVSSGGD